MQCGPRRTYCQCSRSEDRIWTVAEIHLGTTNTVYELETTTLDLLFYGSISQVCSHESFSALQVWHFSNAGETKKIGDDVVPSITLSYAVVHFRKSDCQCPVDCHDSSIWAWLLCSNRMCEFAGLESVGSESVALLIMCWRKRACTGACAFLARTVGYTSKHEDQQKGK
jgi:hypothetical protein